MPLSAGQSLYHDRYRIEKLFGQGGMGAVYKAWDKNLNNYVAIKENLDVSTDAQIQFSREAQMLSRLSHPNLPRVTDHFESSDSGQYLVMDFVEGEDLQQILQGSEGPLPVDQALNWISQVSDALAYLHEQNPPIVHRDIKPANIKITPSGQAVLVDFGIAKEFDPSQATTIGARAVTPGYSPPEQYGKKTTDTRSDVYSLGATAYTMLTGQRPPESIDIFAGIAPPPVPVHELNPMVSSGISAVIKRAMQVNRQERHANANEFKGSLSQALVQQQDFATVDVIAAGAVPVAVAAATERASSPVTPTYVAVDTAAQPTTIPQEQKRGFPCLWVGIIGALILVIIALLSGMVVMFVFGDGLNIFGGEETETADTVALVATDTQIPTPTLPATETPIPLTDTPTVVPPTDTKQPTDTPQPTETLPPIPMEILDWEPENFSFGDSGCNFSDTDCWQGTPGDKVLISSESYFIDPSWPSPHIVFWHSYDMPTGVTSDISIQTSYDWVPVTQFNGYSYWKETRISLTEYSGETVSFRFFMPFGIIEQSTKCDKVLGVTYDCYYVDKTVNSECAF